MSKKRRIVFPTFEVAYWDEKGEEKEVIVVRPVPLNKLEEVRKLQEILITEYVNHDGCLGSLLTDKSVFKTMQNLASMLPVVGKEVKGFDIQSLYDFGDLVQLGQIFFSEAITENMKSQGIKTDNITERLVYHYPEHRYNPTPSAIARIHDLPFFDHFQQKRDEKLQKLQAQLQKELKVQETATAT